MRRFSKEQLDKLERALAWAHKVQEPPRFSPRWLEAIMREIRMRGIRRQPVNVAPSHEVPYLIFWRAAAVVVLVSALFVGSVLTWNAGRADADSSALFAEASMDPTLLAGEP